MKRFFFWVGIVVAAVVVVIGSVAAFVGLSGLPTYDTRKIELTVASTPERVEHGKRLAAQLCSVCHMSTETGRLSGTQLLDSPPEFGVIYSRNITHHPTAGIGSWTDGDVAWLLRTGIHPHTGRYLPPWMPKFPHMSDEDLFSIIAWLRSDDPTLQASGVASRDSELSLLAKFLSRTAFKPFDYPTAPIPHPDTTKPLVYGKYLTTGVYDCYQCHSADFATNNPLDPPASMGFFGGGTKMLDAMGRPMVTSNITSDKQHGIGRYTREQFVTMMRTGIRPNGSPMRYPMVRMTSLSDYALSSMYDYLMSVPALPNSITPTQLAGPWQTAGARLWDEKGCSGCHGASGVGFADMRAASAKYPEDSVLHAVIQHQSMNNALSVMPIYQGHLTQSELSDLGTYVRALKR